MREILFRGKRIDNGEWVYGSFCMGALEQYNGLCGVDGFIRLHDKTKGKTQMHEVDRETVGQYTGLKDKNGKRIYEGDILNLAWMGRSIVKFDAGLFEADNGKRFGIIPLANAPFGKEGVEIIGNIHDDPELLEGDNQ